MSRRLVLVGVALLVGACAPARPVHDPPVTGARSHNGRMLEEAFRIDPAQSEAEMASTFAAQLSAETERCVVRRVEHEPGSAVVTADLGLGCAEGNGSFSVTFQRIGTEARASFDFTEFAHARSHLDGRWEAQIGEDRRLAFQGAAPWKDLVPVISAPPPPTLPTRPSRQEEQGLEALQIVSGMLYLIYVPFAIALAWK